MREIEREIRVRMRTIIMLSLIRDITETLSLSLPHYRAAALLHQTEKKPFTHSYHWRHQPSIQIIFSVQLYTQHSYLEVLIITVSKLEMQPT